MKAEAMYLEDYCVERSVLRNNLASTSHSCIDLVPVVGEIMQDFYPEVTDKQEFIMKVIKNEEERFHETLSDGMAILSGVIDKAKSSGTSIVPGADAFRLI